MIEKMSYNQIDDILEKLRYTIEVTRYTNPVLYNQLFTAYRSVSQKRNSPGPDLSNAIQKAKGLLRNPKNSFPSNVQDAVNKTDEMNGFSSWETTSFSKPFSIAGRIIKTPSADPAVPGTITIKGLKFNNSKAGQYVKSIMGPALQDASGDTVLRATREVWDRFVELVPVWSQQQSEFENYNIGPLPSESKFNGQAPSKPFQGEKSLQVDIVNADPNGRQDWDIAQKGNDFDYSKKGIQLTFSPEDLYFYPIAEYAKKLNLNPKLYPHQAAMVFYTIDAPALHSLSKRLQHDGYPSKPFNAAITSLSGKDVGDIQKSKTNISKSKVKLSAAVVQSSIRENIMPNPPDKDAFSGLIRQKYPAAFQGGESWSQAVADGIYFASTRQSSIIADEPGSGKTSQAMIAADHTASETGKKILVITPGGLIRENWTSPEQGPIRFCGHTPDMIHVAKSADMLTAAINNPKIRWIIVADSTLGQSSEGAKIAAVISDSSKKGAFSCAIMDEFQQIKDIDSDVATNIRRAVGTNGIPRRIGLTGTPADNDPSNLYQQLRLIRHPLVYKNKGLKDDGVTRDLVTQQNKEGFANQFLGGEALLKPDESDEIKASSIIQWASSLKDSDMLALMDLFSTTYIRRNKSDIRPDLPEKVEKAVPVADNESQKWAQREADIKQQSAIDGKPGVNAKQKILKEMAFAKAPITAQKAIDHVKSGGGKLFIVSKHPDVAKLICDQINGSLLVTGSTNDIQRDKIASEFKNPKSQCRVAVYTLGTGAVGLNFAVATNAIFNDMDWNPSTNLQAEYRIHRINSQHPVNIEYQYIPGTYDEQQYTRVLRKRKVNESINNILRASGQADRSQLAHEFVMNLVDSLMFELDLSPYQSAKVDKLKEKLSLKMQKTVAANSNWYKKQKLCA
jgi:hypothetical protein